MPEKGRLAAIEKQRIIARLAEGFSIEVSPTELKRDARTLAKFIRNLNIKYRKNKGTRRNLFNFRKIFREVVGNPSSISASYFARAGVSPRFRHVRCNVLSEMVRNIKPMPRTPLNLAHETKRLNKAPKYMKMDFQHILFTD